jgi:hypothetical protein
MKHFRFTLFVICLVLALTSLGLTAAQDTITITIRCKASPPTEDWRCNNFAEVEEQVESALGVNLDLTLIQDNKDWGDYKTEFVLAS